MPKRDDRPVKVLSFEAPLTDAERVELLAKQRGVNRSEILRRFVAEGLDRHPLPTNTNTDTSDDSGPTDPATPSAERGADVVDFNPIPAAQVRRDAATGRVVLTRHDIVEEDGEGGIRTRGTVSRTLV